MATAADDLSSPHLTPEEAQREAVRLNDLLGDMGYRRVALSEWWNWMRHEELGGVTALKAWTREDYGAVIALVEGKWRSYEASRVLAFPAADAGTRDGAPVSREEFRRKYLG